MADTGARAFEALVGQHEQMTQQLQDNAQKTTAFLAELSAVMSRSARLQVANSRLEAFQSDSRTSHVLPASAPLDRAGPIEQHLQSIESDISAQRAAVSQAQDSLDAAERLLSTSALTLPHPLPAPTPHAALGAQEDLSADAPDDQRRLRARSDAGPCPSRDDSPHVDPVTHPLCSFPCLLSPQCV